MNAITSHLRKNLVAYLALFLALGGTSYAASKLPANSVTGKQIKASAVTSSDVKDRSLLAKDFKNGQLPAGPQGAAGAQGAPGPAGPEGSAGPKGEPGSALGFAHVTFDGKSFKVDAGRSRGVAQANVQRIGAGKYCFRGLSFKPTSITLTIDSLSPASTQVFANGTVDSSDQQVIDLCGADVQALVGFAKPDGSGTLDTDFYVVFN
jgi:hypothetical protein